MCSRSWCACSFARSCACVCCPVVCSVDTMDTILASVALLSMYSLVHPAAVGSRGSPRQAGCARIRHGTAGGSSDCGGAVNASGAARRGDHGGATAGIETRNVPGAAGGSARQARRGGSRVAGRWSRIAGQGLASPTLSKGCLPMIAKTSAASSMLTMVKKPETLPTLCAGSSGQSPHEGHARKASRGALFAPRRNAKVDSSHRSLCGSYCTRSPTALGRLSGVDIRMPHEAVAGAERGKGRRLTWGASGPWRCRTGWSTSGSAARVPPMRAHRSRTIGRFERGFGVDLMRSTDRGPLICEGAVSGGGVRDGVRLSRSPRYHCGCPSWCRCVATSYPGRARERCVRRGLKS